MKKLNLIYPDVSDLSYKVSHFPDGQKNITIFDNTSDPVLIICRLRNFMDLELLACTVSSLREMGVKEIHANCLYFLGSRSDRKFEKGSNNYLKTVICPFVNLLNLASITIMDPHSYCLEMGLNNFQKMDNAELVKWALATIDNDSAHIVSPDEGAGKKIYDLDLGERKIIMAGKHRDTKTGAFLGFHVPLSEDDKDKDLIWIDDICDGGGTFIGEAKEADKQGHKGKKYLIVTHGIFSAGFEMLAEHFSGIYSTNSYSDINHPIIKQINVLV